MSGRIVPAELISLYGLHIGPAVPLTGGYDANGFLPTILGGVQVPINGIAVPLLYVPDGQINLAAPMGLTPGTTVTLRISRIGITLAALRVGVDTSDPGVFMSGSEYAAAINQDGTVNSQANPARVGQYASIWVTGTGYARGADGQMQGSAQQFCTQTVSLCSLLIGGTPVAPLAAPVSYSGAAPGMPNGVI